MARGNQRDLARAKNQAKEAAKKKGNDMNGYQMQAARENAADIMRRKQAESEAKKAAAKGSDGGGGSKK
ncbi:hypothetical protein ESCO_001398 [Escovopsis weberi]|uniref:Small EDRK-rich factor-like N-terminal domain-containing protein n=1 Tax=Escovopsis weberi TaxID=150374 RepID=A0A0M9VTC0_ESCWE|nr:hypothetical protein ESCO_001398 [Escovopsis weberi]